MPKPNPSLIECWQTRISEWQTSCLSIAEWCRQRDLPDHQSAVPAARISKGYLNSYENGKMM